MTFRVASFCNVVGLLFASTSLQRGGDLPQNSRAQGRGMKPRVIGTPSAICLLLPRQRDYSFRVLMQSFADRNLTVNALVYC